LTDGARVFRYFAPPEGYVVVRPLGSMRVKGLAAAPAEGPEWSRLDPLLRRQQTLDVNRL
jgi:hypothetical protein